MISAYLIHLAIIVGIYIILALSLQLAMGYAGLLNLGHIAFFGIGAYTSALLTLAGWPFWISLISAGVLSMLFGFLLAIPTYKLKGDYLALATMGFSFVVYAVLLNWTQLTRGPLGLPGIPKPSLFGFTFSSKMYLWQKKESLKPIKIVPKKKKEKEEISLKVSPKSSLKELHSIIRGNY